MLGLARKRDIYDMSLLWLVWYRPFTTVHWHHLVTTLSVSGFNMYLLGLEGVHGMGFERCEKPDH